MVVNTRVCFVPVFHSREKKKCRRGDCPEALFLQGRAAED